MTKKWVVKWVILVLLACLFGLFLPIICQLNKPVIYQLILILMGLFVVFKSFSKSVRLILYNYSQSLDLPITSELPDLESSLRLFQTQLENGIQTNIRYKKINKTLNLAIEVNNALIKAMDIQTIYDFVLSKAIEAVEKCDKGSIMLLNEEGFLEFKSLIGFDENFYNIKIKKEDAFLYKLTEGLLNKAIIVNDVVAFNKKYMTPDEFDKFYEKFPQKYQTALSAPIRYDDTFLGVINLDLDSPGGFNEEDLAIMDLFASQLEVTIRNSNLIKEILYLSRFDSLTGAYNRSYFEEVIESVIQLPQVTFGFVVIDINDLKKVNDVYGHAEGDFLLKTFSEVVKKQIRLSDYFARIGGDEFVLVLNELDGLDISKIMLRIMGQLKAYKEEHNLQYEISFSYGITLFPTEAQTADELYLISDEKMYNMKRNFKEKK